MDYYLTAERLEEIKNELNDLKTKKRIEVAERLKRAKELGDLSENAEYTEAREEQNQIEMRIVELEEVVKNAAVIQKATSKDLVQVGSTVELEKNGARLKYKIVGPDESRPEAGLISNESPLGKAFLGKKKGETAKVKTPSGESVYKIISIE